MTDKPLSAVGDRLLLGRLERPRALEPRRIAVVGDPHVATRATGTYRVFHRTEQRLRAVIDDINDRDVDLTIFPGDLTKDGEPWNYERLDTLLEELEVPFLATPGNHDLQKRSDDHRCPSAAAFADRYANGSLPARYDVGDVAFFVVDSASGGDGPYVDTHRGRISRPQLEWLEERLPAAETSIVVCHHNPIPIVRQPLCRTETWETFTMRERERFGAILERHDVDLVVSGHHHLPSLVRRNGVRQLVSPAVASYPQAYCLLEIEETGTNVWLVSHAGEVGRTEAYQLLAEGPAFRRTLLGITETTLDDAPVLYEPSRIAQAPLTD
ncbi:metallophosphoesterase [Natronococcus sp. A-GB7]|uniref:metallophosphoesterase family protein n=1 Tax=Natronococcus sp. A-GB7 TaxID=3037649 RepID=UPI00241D8B63|nr:metallophosphoesterase [Natronococcus sp. A-GB7]MDG5818242.1 metallophosphoesterase [Natronococcus sp. A-GB7]